MYVRNICHIIIVIIQKKSKLIYFEFSSHCLVWLVSRLEPAREPPPSRAEPDLLARKTSEPSRARLVHLPSRAELSSAEAPRPED